MKYLKSFYENQNNLKLISYKEFAEIKNKEKIIPFTQMDNEFLKQLADYFKGKNMEIKSQDRNGYIHFSPITYTKGFESIMNIYKFNGFFIIKKSKMTHVGNNTYTELNSGNYGLYETDYLGDCFN